MAAEVCIVVSFWERQECMQYGCPLANALCTGSRARAALIKVCLAYEHGVLPANLHFTQPNPNSASLNAGILKVLPTGT